MRTVEEIGAKQAKQHKKYVSSVFENITAAIHDTISKNFFAIVQTVAAKAGIQSVSEAYNRDK